jgi:hypothetical protein
MEHLLVFGFIFLLTATMEYTFPVKDGIKRY